MNKAILTEIEDYNYTIEGIAHKTGISEIRVTRIIGNLVLRGKLEGEVNQEQTEFIPGMVSQEYKKKIVLTVIAQILAPISFIVATVLPIIFVISVAIGDSFLIEQWTINLFSILAIVTILICVTSIVVSFIVRDTKIGKVTLGFSVVALVFALMVTIMVVLFLTVFQEFFGQMFF